MLSGNIPPPAPCPYIHTHTDYTNTEQINKDPRHKGCTTNIKYLPHLAIFENIHRTIHMEYKPYLAILEDELTSVTAGRQEQADIHEQPSRQANEKAKNKKPLTHKPNDTLPTQCQFDLNL